MVKSEPTCLRPKKLKLPETDRQTEREETENERTIFYLFFINEGNGISTILFLHAALGQKQTDNNNKNKRQRENAFCINKIETTKRNM